MSFTQKELKEAFDALGLARHHAAVSATLLLRQDQTPLCVSGLRDVLTTAELPPAAISEVCDYLLTRDTAMETVLDKVEDTTSVVSAPGPFLPVVACELLCIY